MFNFRSFQGRHVIDFSHNGLMILRGRNLDTGGDSGAGKTNVLLAIAHLFGYCRLSSKALQCWFDDKPFYVEVELDTPDGAVTVKRGAKGLTIDKLRGKVAEAKLDKICGVPVGLREALTYRDQLKPLRFLAMKDREMKEFLFQVLGLGNLEDEIAERTKSLGRLEMTATSAANTLKIFLDQVVGSLADPVKPTLESAEPALALWRLQREVVQREWANVRALEADLANIPDPDTSQLAALRKSVGEADTVLTLINATEKARLQAWQEGVDMYRRQLRELDARFSEGDQHRRDLAALQKVEAKLALDQCSMCERQWDRAAAKLAECRQQIAKHEAMIELIESYRPEVAVIRAQMAAHAFEPDPRVAKIKEVREGLVVKLAQASQSLQVARQLATSDTTTRLAQARQAVAEAQRQADLAEAAVDAITRRSIDLEARYQEAVAAQQRGLQRLEQYKLDVETARQEYERESDYLDLLKGFRNRIFDEVLVSIGTEASNIIATLPNAQHITIEFKSERITGENTIQERITPVVLLHGIERTLDESVSGGQLTSLSLAVDLAVVRVISARLGCNLDWIILDEAFNGHDQVTKASCLEMLSTYAQDKLVVIVDHSSEFKEMFSKIVTVEHNHTKSSVA